METIIVSQMEIENYTRALFDSILLKYICNENNITSFSHICMKMSENFIVYESVNKKNFI